MTLIMSLDEYDEHYAKNLSQFGSSVTLIFSLYMSTAGRFCVKNYEMGLQCFFSALNRFLFTRVVVAVQSCNESIFMVDFEQVFIPKVNPILTFVLEELVLVSRSDVVGTWEDGKKINANVNA